MEKYNETYSFRGENGRILRRVLAKQMPSNVAIIAMLGDDAEDYMAKEFPKECKQTRVDIDRRVVEVIKEWKK